MKIINKEAAKLIDDFEQAVLLFGEVQDEHALFLKRNQLNDVQKWSDERSEAMGRLQQALTAVWGCDSLRADARLGKALQRQIGVIVARERELTDHVKSCQQKLQREMGKVRKGKKVVGGYGATVQHKSSGLCFKNTL